MKFDSIRVVPVDGGIADDIGNFLLYDIATETGLPLLVRGGKYHAGEFIRPGQDAHGDDSAARRAEMLAAADAPPLAGEARRFVRSALTANEPSHAERNAAGWMESIREMVAAISAGEESGDDEKEEAARIAAQESPLSVLVRGDWYQPGDEHRGGGATEFEILLSTGGPALRIVGELDGYGSPQFPRLEWQDWGTPWTRFFTDEADDVALNAFVAQFYFVEG